MLRFFCSLFLIAISFTCFAKPLALLEAISERHSGKAFDPDHNVENEKQILLIEAARWSASSYNDQPWNFIFCDKKTNPTAYNKALNCLVQLNQQWAKDAPLLIIIVANSYSPSTDTINPTAEYDTGGSATQMSLQAVSMGLMVHQMGGFSSEKVREAFSIPDHFKPMAVMAVGYEIKNTPALKRTRNPISSNFFNGMWGKKLAFD